MQGITLAIMAAGNALISLPLALLLFSQQPAGDATIRGRVLDPDGQPAPAVEMMVITVESARERGVVQPAVTGADGRFALTSVPAGQFLLQARPVQRVVAGQKTPLFDQPRAYFPGVHDRSDAWPIDVKPGEIIELDFHMPPVFIGSIKTVVTGPDGYTLDELRVIRPEANQIKNVKLSDDGIGYVDSLREGRYVVAARGRSHDARLAASEVVHMTGGEIIVALPLEPAARVTGRVIVDGGGVPPLQNARVVASWTDGTIGLDPLARDEGDVGPDGSFTIDGLFGTRTFHLAGVADEWQVSAVRLGGSDITGGIELRAGSVTDITIVVSRR